MRVTVGTVVELVAAGHTRDEMLREYPYLEAKDTAKALSSAAWRAQEASAPPCVGASVASGGNSLQNESTSGSLATSPVKNNCAS